jgi:antitoxin HicB
MIPDVPYRFTIRPLPEDEGDGYLIEFPDLPGCMSNGATIEQTITNGLDAMRGWTPATRAEGHPIPAPSRSGGPDLLGDNAPAGRALQSVGI